MKRKTAIKKLMGMGVSRDYAKAYLDMIHICTGGSNLYAVNFYDIYRDNWLEALQLVKMSGVIIGDGE